MSDWGKGTKADASSDTAIVEAVVVDAVIRTAETMAVNDVLNAALDEAGYASVPSDHDELERFLFGPLYARAASALGVEYAGRMVKAALLAKTAVPSEPKRTASSVFRAVDVVTSKWHRRAQSDTEPDLEPGAELGASSGVKTSGTSRGGTAAGRSHARSKSPYRALILVQEPSLHNALTTQLEKTGAVVSSAAGRSLARQVARDVEPDVIIADVGASSDVLSMDEARSLAKDTPIIALSTTPLSESHFVHVFQHPCSAMAIARAVVDTVTATDD